MDVKRIDINCDLGEGAGQDELLFPLISSCNIACGGHAGDRESMRRTIHLALTNEVQIGAHPSYPDRANFGRVKMDIGTNQLFESVGEQVENLREIARQEGANIHYLKPHGALYNVLNNEAELAQQFLSFLGDLGENQILGLPNCILNKLSKETEVKLITEGFADRAYTNEGQLLSRTEKGALIENPEMAAAQVKQMIIDQSVNSVSGNKVEMTVQSICLHSDTPSASIIARAIDAMLSSENIIRRSF